MFIDQLHATIPVHSGDMQCYTLNIRGNAHGKHTYNTFPRNIYWFVKNTIARNDELNITQYICQLE